MSLVPGSGGLGFAPGVFLADFLKLVSGLGSVWQQGARRAALGPLDSVITVTSSGGFASLLNGPCGLSDPEWHAG